MGYPARFNKYHFVQKQRDKPAKFDLFAGMTGKSDVDQVFTELIRHCSTTPEINTSSRAMIE
jgi:hypothetical protein